MFIPPQSWLDLLRPGSHLITFYRSEGIPHALVPFLEGGLLKGESVLYMGPRSPSEITIDRVPGLIHLRMEEGEDLYSRLALERSRAIDGESPLLRVALEMDHLPSDPMGQEAYLEHLASQGGIVILCLYKDGMLDPSTMLDIFLSHPLFLKEDRLWPNVHYAPASKGWDPMARLDCWMGGLDLRRTRTSGWEEGLIVGVDAKGRISSISKLAQGFFGRSEDEVLGREIVGMLIPEVEATGRRLQPIIRGVFEEPERYPSLISQGVHRNGDLAWISWKVRPIRKGGKLLEVRLEGTRVAGDEMADGSACLLDAWDSSTEPTFGIDGENRIILWNKGMEALTGRSRSAMLGEGGYAYSIPFYGERKPMLIDMLDWSEALIEKEHSYVKRSGAALGGRAFAPALYGGRGAEILFRVHPLQDENGRKVGALASLRDVSESVQLEERLNRREMMMAAVATSANVLLADRDLPSAIVDSLEILGATTEADRACIFENQEGETGGHIASHRYEWSCEDGRMDFKGQGSSKTRPSYERLFSRWYNRLQKGEPIRGLARDFSPMERDVFESLGILSFLVLPIIVEGKLWGFLSLDNYHSERLWDDSEVAVLKAAVPSIGGAVVRWRAEKAQRRLRSELETQLRERTAELDAKKAELEEMVHHLSAEVQGEVQKAKALLQPMETMAEDGQALRAGLEEVGRTLDQIEVLAGVTKSHKNENPQEISFGEMVAQAVKRTGLALSRQGVTLQLGDKWPFVLAGSGETVEVLVYLIQNSLVRLGGRNSASIEIGHSWNGVFFVRDNGLVPKDDELDGENGIARCRRLVEGQGGRLWIEWGEETGCTVWFTIPLASPLGKISD